MTRRAFIYAFFLVHLLCSTAIVVFGVPARASARRWSLEGEANLKLDARYCHLFESSLSNGLSDTITGGLGGRALAGKDWYGFMVGLDARFGAGLQGGFAYEFVLSPLGAGVIIDRTATLGLIFGAGIDGVTARVPFAVTFPAELLLELDLADSVRLAGWLSPRWILLADTRQGGQRSLPLGDEFQTGLTLRIGRSRDSSRFAWSNGYYAGAIYAEHLDSYSITAVIGHGINVGY